MKPRPLPRSLDDLRGLRAARWIRESTAGQVDRFGPDAQREQQDRAIERYGLQDTGREWLVAHSGRTIGATGSFVEMLAAAGESYDVLVVGYVSRFARDARTALNARHDMHAAGAAILFADERILTSDEDRWLEWYRETGEAEAYSRKLAKRIREGYEAKFRREADQGGNAPLGFRRTGPAHTLEVDPSTIGEVIAIFRRYAVGTVSLADLSAETGYRIGHLAELLKNPLYNGWATRHGERTPAPWRRDPPVDDALWGRVAAIRARKAWHGGGRRRGATPDPLRGLLFCPCGAGIQSWGTGRDGRQRRAHPLDRPCPHWGGQRLYPAETWLRPLREQLEGLRLDDRLLADIVAASRAAETPVPPSDAARADRERRELALQHAAGRLGDAEYLAAVARLRAQGTPAVTAPPELDPARVVGYYQDLARTIGERMNDEERADLFAGIYERLEVAGPEFVRMDLTPDARRYGLQAALPDRVRVSWLGEPGRGRADGPNTRLVRIPIAGRTEWLRERRRAG